MKIHYNRKVRPRDLIMISVMLFVSLLFVLKYNLLHEQFDQEVGRYGVGTVFAISFIFECIPQFLHPFSTVILAAGMGANLWLATTLSIAGSFTGALLGFTIGRKYGFHVLCPFLNRRKIDKTLAKIDKYGSIFVCIAALLPLPYIPVVFGSVGIQTKTFWMFGIIPRAISFVFLAVLLHYGIQLL